MSSVVILVAGVDYPKYLSAGTGSGTQPSFKLRALGKDLFLEMAMTYARFAIRQRKADAIVLFDIGTGFVSAFEAIDAHGNPKQPIRLLTFAPIETENYRRVVRKGEREQDFLLLPLENKIQADSTDTHIVHCPAFNLVAPDRDRQVRVGEYLQSFLPGGSRQGGVEKKVQMPIGTLDVYKQILSQKPETRELHFFSHSFFDGPILANSVQFGSADKKSFLDSDGRPRDFIPPNLEKPEELAKRLAGAACVIWGCNVAKPWRKRIRDILRATRQDRTARIGFDFRESDWDQISRSEKLKDFEFFFGSPVQEGARLVSQPFSRGELAKVIKEKLIPRTYAKRLSTAARVPVFAALPGTASNYDRYGKSLHLLHVPQKRPDDTNNPETNDETGNSGDKLSLIDVLRFYSDEFRQFPGGLTFDLNQVLKLGDLPEEFHEPYGRGYARFSPGQG